MDLEASDRYQSYFTLAQGGNEDSTDLTSEAYITFRFRRKRMFYFVEVVVPAALFLFVAYIGFFINANVAPARVGVTVIPVLIMRTLLNQTYSRMQIISYFTRLTKFLIASQSLSVFCVMEFGIVSYFLAIERDRERRRKQLVASHKLLRTHLEMSLEEQETQRQETHARRPLPAGIWKVSSK